MGFTPENRESREESIGSTTVRIISYQMGEEFVATVDNVDPGATIARGKGATREAAETSALDEARTNLSS